MQLCTRNPQLSRDPDTAMASGMTALCLKKRLSFGSFLRSFKHPWGFGPPGPEGLRFRLQDVPPLRTGIVRFTRSSGRLESTWRIQELPSIGLSRFIVRDMIQPELCLTFFPKHACDAPILQLDPKLKAEQLGDLALSTCFAGSYFEPR